MKLILVRHGESVWNQKNLFTGWTDVELSEKGILEAEKAGQLLKNETIDICFTSVLQRALKTAEIILNVSGKIDIPQIHDFHLNERHYGALQGLNKAETAEKYGDEQVKLWRRSYNVRPPLLDKEDKRNPLFDEKYKNIDPSCLPLAESLEDTINRVIPYYNSEILPKIIDSKNVLIVAHGNSLRALWKHLSKLTDEEIININIPTGSPFVYTFNNGILLNSEPEYIK